MRNFQDTFKTRKRSFISANSIFMTLSLNIRLHLTSGFLKARIETTKNFRHEFDGIISE